MPVTVVVGGQYGSEGKGKVAGFFAEQLDAHAVIRCGGSNSGHTVYHKDNKYIFQHLPTACFNPSIVNILVAGSYIDVEILLAEIALAGVAEDKLCIDPYAVIISDIHKKDEADRGLNAVIGSTGSGTGAAVTQRLRRSADIVFAKDIPEFKPYIGCSKELIYKMMLDDKRVIIEGTQGYGLSILHSTDFPYVTTRDTTAAGFISEAGVSPLHVDQIILVLRAFPIRVAGNSGPLRRELSWDTVATEAMKPVEPELTSVTKQKRRVARFDPGVVLSAITANAPTTIVLNHVDYFQESIREEQIRSIESMLLRKVDWIGDGPVSMKMRESFRCLAVNE
jgi:adenylosuccinate synthase